MRSTTRTATRTATRAATRNAGGLTWATARTLDDLGELTARWLEGTEPTMPGYADGGPDDETAPIAGRLAALNRRGLVTHGSQPGVQDADGRQRAFLEAYCTRATRRRLEQAIVRTDLVMLRRPPGRIRGRLQGDRAWIPVTVDVAGELYTSVGAWQPTSWARAFWSEHCQRDTVRALTRAWQITIFDPQWGRVDELWDQLAAALPATADGERP